MNEDIIMTDQLSNDVSSIIELMGEGKHTIASLATKLDEVITKLNALSTASRGTRNYGPSSQTQMTEQLAWRILFGDLKSMKVKEIAESEGLSRGQVYSVRGSYTFNYVKADSYFQTEEGDVIPNEAPRT